MIVVCVLLVSHQPSWNSTRMGIFLYLFLPAMCPRQDQHIVSNSSLFSLTFSSSPNSENMQSLGQLFCNLLAAMDILCISIWLLHFNDNYLIIFQSNIHSYLHLRVCNQSNGSWFYCRPVYIPSRRLELARFHCHNFSVSSTCFFRSTFNSSKAETKKKQWF